jgi:hypothetical protein
MTREEMIAHNMNFWEHLTDHLIMAVSFTILGILLTICWLSRLLLKKFRIDYKLEKGEILRVFSGKKKWFVVNPGSRKQIFELIALSIWDTGKDLDVSKSEMRRVRIISRIVTAIAVLAIISGFIMLMSALLIDLNPFNYM